MKKITDGNICSVNVTNGAEKSVIWANNCARTYKAANKINDGLTCEKQILRLGIEKIVLSLSYDDIA